MRKIGTINGSDIISARIKRSLFWEKIALGSMFLCASCAFADEALWKMYVEAGTEAYKDGRYATAEIIFLAARTEAEGFGSNDVRLALTLFWLARVDDAEQNDKRPS